MVLEVYAFHETVKLVGIVVSFQVGDVVLRLAPSCCITLGAVSEYDVLLTFLHGEFLHEQLELSGLRFVIGSLFGASLLTYTPNTPPLTIVNPGACFRSFQTQRPCSRAVSTNPCSFRRPEPTRNKVQVGLGRRVVTR